MESIIMVIKTLSYEYEIIIIDDWSTDYTWQIIYDLSQLYPEVKGIRFSRNFGKEIALTAWLEYACGDAVITIDADGQYPVQKIPDFVAKREEWYKIVYNKRPYIKNASFIKHITSKLFYIFFNFISEFKIESQITDYILLDRKVVNIFLQFGEKNRMYRWLVHRIWHKKFALVFDALPNERHAKSWYSYKKLFNLALHSITSFSVRPLKIVGILGMILIFMTSMMLIFVLCHIILMNNTLWFTNLGILTLINTFYVGIMMTSLGMIAIYIANIHQETIKRPLYIVEDELNIYPSNK